MSFLTARRGRTAAVAAGLLALLAPTASHAITNGKSTDGYQEVGAFVVELLDAEGAVTGYTQLCTGTVVSSRVVLTASHCMVRDDYAPNWGDVYFTLAQRIGDGTSWTLLEDLPLLSGTPVPDSRYTGLANYRYDVGAFVLDGEVTVPPATLAGPRALDDKSLRGTTFTTVGYGIERYDKTKSTQAFQPPEERMVAEQPLVNVHRDYVMFSMNLARGFSGTCYGDSGGPHFNAAGEIVAITTTGDIPCKSTDQASRTNTDEALGFIEAVIADPEAYAAGQDPGV